MKLGARRQIRIATSILGVTAVALGLGVVATCGSGGGGGKPACGPPLSGSCINGEALFCTEFAGVPEAQVPVIMQSCSSDPGDPEPDIWSSTEGCSRSGKVGGCKAEQNGICVAVWYPSFAAGAEAELRRICGEMGGTWLNP
jgi:hypothetical protein